MGCGAPKEEVAVHRIEEIYGIELPAAALAPPGLPTEQFDVTVNLPHRQVQLATSEQQVGALVKMKLHEDFPSEVCFRLHASSHHSPSELAINTCLLCTLVHPYEWPLL